MLFIAFAVLATWFLTGTGTVADTMDPDDGQSDVSGMDDMLDLDLEQLMQIDVTSVSGVAQPWFKTPAAMYVLTSEDIRRAGHMSIPEALRMVPGLTVAQNTSWTWSISSRGFRDTFANKLQVLVDGREIYDPMFSGTIWDIHDPIFEDLDRVEVVRGPGATLWGANAVNGVINITSKSAKETQGLYVSGGTGTMERGFGEMRYGGQLSDNAWFRVWGTYHNHDNFDLPGGGDGPDDNDMTRGGFRIDTELDEAEGNTTFTIIGDMHHTRRQGQLVSVPIPGHFTSTSYRSDGRADGYNILFRLAQEQASNEGWHLKAYYTRTSRAAFGDFQVDRDIVDLDFQHYFPLGDGHELIWGVNGRYTSDTTESSSVITFGPTGRDTSQVTAFVQDTVTLVEDTLFAMIGSKFENNDYTGFEYQPSARIWWTPDEDHTLWAGVSRAVRVPARSDNDLSYTTAFADTGLLGGGAPSGIFIPLIISGDPDNNAEVLQAYEAGYRQRITEDVTVDIAGFYNDYDDLITGPDNGLFGTFSNGGTATTYGVETAVDWVAADNWRITASHSFMYARANTTEVKNEAQPPRNQFQVRSALDVTEDLEFNTALYYYDEDTVGSVTPVTIDSYVRVDAGITWRPNPNTELTIWGQNLLDPSHPETAAFFPAVSINEVPRGVYFRLTKRF